MTQPLRFSGVMPANVLPFTSDLAIDEPAYRRHLRWLADTRGVTGIVANGHASEVSSLSRDERKRSLAIALDEVGGACPIIAGVYSDGTQEAVDLARDATAAGAAGLPICRPSRSTHAARAIWTVPGGSTTGWRRWCRSSTRRPSWTCTTG